MNGLLKQADEPLFPEIAWEAPQTKTAAKKLLILGGQFSRVGEVQSAYTSAIRAGIGEVRIVLPDKLRSTIGQADHVLYVSSTPAGSMDKSAYPELKAFINESDGSLVGSGAGKHPDTAVIIEQILLDIKEPLVLTGDVVDLISHKPELLGVHTQRVLVASPQQYVKLANLLKLPVEIVRDENLLSKVKLLQSINEQLGLVLVMAGHDTLINHGSKTSHTAVRQTVSDIESAAWLAVYYLQHQDKFKASTAAVFEMNKSS